MYIHSLTICHSSIGGVLVMIECYLAQLQRITSGKIGIAAHAPQIGI